MLITQRVHGPVICAQIIGSYNTMNFGNIEKAASDILIGTLSNLPPDVDNWTTDDKLIAQNLVHQFLESNVSDEAAAGKKSTTTEGVKA